MKRGAKNPGDAIILAAALLVIVVLKAATGEAPAGLQPRIVIVFGDSITEGGALPKDQKPSLWLNRIETEARGALVMINEGKGGRPTASIKEFDAMLQRRKEADLLLIALGTNDSRDITDACVPKAVANVRSMVERARRVYGDGLKVLLVGPPNINKTALVATKPIANEREAKLRELGEAYQRLASEMHCDFISLFGVVPEGSMRKDGVHPDAEGNGAIAQALSSKLRP